MSATSIADPRDDLAASEMVRDLVEGQEAVVRTARSILPIVNKADDQPTIDLLTQRLQVHEKAAWMLRSLLEPA
jgi:starvation-inducible DNA-binding protein